MSELSHQIITAKKLLAQIEELAACPTRTDKEKALATWNLLIEEVKSMGVEIERIE